MKAFLAIVALLAATSAHAVGFTGYYDPSHWTETNDGNADVIATPLGLELISPSDRQSPGGYARFTITAPASGLVSFDWSFTTEDSPEYEAFGYLYNGLFTNVTDMANMVQAGSSSFTVFAGDIFGFAAFAADEFGGSSFSNVTNFAAPIPEPSMLALFGVGGMLLLAQQARRRRSS